MEPEGGHRNSVIKRRNPIEFGLVWTRGKYEYHKEVHETKPQCKDCERVFANKSSLWRHRNIGGASRRRPPTASRLKGPRKQKSFAYKLLKRGFAKSFAYKLFKRGLTNLMSPTSTSGVAPPL
ncbi:hypothetical protein EVAR_10852_1 [Eumeta japonica]|uniref:C2H2-type domain-containing protein n=1 Tax=Eumeta variegata TaxID=151549 RepID=A0A4C1USR9_EUMVA|nr:hypothetical protein EVAR_10852_1 [Eumeta japonica]